MSNESNLLRRVVKQYLGSGDFNGYRFGRALDPNLSGSALRQFLTKLITADKIAVRLDGFHLNPMIRRTADASKEQQIAMLDKSNLDPSAFIVLYPTPSVLKKVVKPSDYAGRPFSLMLAHGCAQLEYRSFDLSVLESYRNDPRYHYEVDDMFGYISVTDEFYRQNKIKPSDHTFLQTFGFAYDDDMNRAVAVYLRYLHDLTPEHQQIWRARMLENSYKVHPDYHRATVIGDWALSVPILKAFCMELQHINKMCELMKRPPLFKNDFSAGKPRGLALLIRPTADEYQKFILLLDKALSDNINVEFFLGEVPREEEIERRDGRIEVRQLGTIRQFKMWVQRKFRTADTKPIEEMFATLRKVRKLRQSPAHVISDDTFDQKFFKMQRELVIDAYKAVQLIRLMFGRHPACAGYRVEDVLVEGKISTY